MPRMIDPPEGYLYGFPKPLVGSEGMDLDDWLIANGYPKAEVRKWPKGVPCRVWGSDEDV